MLKNSNYNTIETSKTIKQEILDNNPLWTTDISLKLYENTGDGSPTPATTEEHTEDVSIVKIEKLWQPEIDTKIAQEAGKYHNKHYTLAHPSHPNQIMVTFYNTNITTKNMQILQELCFEKDFKQYLLQKFWWNEQTFKNIDWKNIKK